MKIILKIIYKFLVVIDRIVFKFFGKSILYYFRDMYENDLYIKKKILSSQVSFYVPNKTIKWRQF